ncbi:unnamed protein product [Urochloa humidicola]
MILKTNTKMHQDLPADHEKNLKEPTESAQLSHDNDHIPNCFLLMKICCKIYFDCTLYSGQYIFPNICNDIKKAPSNGYNGAKKQSGRVEGRPHLKQRKGAGNCRFLQHYGCLTN